MKNLSEFQEELELTEDQITQIAALKEEMKAEMKSLKEMEREERKAQMQTIRANFKESMESILTTEQLAILDDMKEEAMENRKARKENHKAMAEELKTYQQTEVQPVMLEQRAKLETQITAADKVNVDKLRDWMAEQKEVMKAKREALREERKSQKAEGLEAHKRGKKHRKGAHRKGSRGLIKMLENDEEHSAIAEALVDNYSDEIDALSDDIADDRARWKEDREAIVAKYVSEENRQRMKKKRAKKGVEADENLKDYYKKLRFILMEPEGVGTSTASGGQNNDLHQIKLYPNPAISTQTLEFRTERAGMVQVDVIDKSGNILQSLYSGQMEVGAHSLQVDVRNLKGQVFYYRIKDEAGMSSKQFMVNN